MTQNIPWKIRFDSHSFMLNRPLASIGFGQKFGIAALIVVGIVCVLRASQGAPAISTAPGPSLPAVPVAPPTPVKPKVPKGQPDQIRPPQ